MVATYQFDISRAADAGTLHHFREDIAEDPTLELDEKEELHAAIHARFCQLNAQAPGSRKPRW